MIQYTLAEIRQTIKEVGRAHALKHKQARIWKLIAEAKEYARKEAMAEAERCDRGE